MPIFEVTYKAVCPGCGHHWKTTARREANDKIDASESAPAMQCESCKAFTVPYRVIVGAAGGATATIAR
ncbi:MAG TPA: hypothetical protein VI319_12425 [Burkholderiales bacterium]